MSLFDAISISGTGINAMQTWIDTTSGNLANMNDAVAAGQPTYAEQTPVFTPIAGSTTSPSGDGVAVSDVALGSTVGDTSLDPSSGEANSAGEVSTPNISMSDQLVQLMEAQQSYSADTSALNKAVSAYQSGLTIGS
jgi:flagellar basal-body rod protein FlgC